MTQYRELYQSGNYEACEDECRKQLSSNNSDPDIWFALCLSLISQKKWQEAMSASGDALGNLKLPPHEASVFHQFAGDAALGSGDDEAAIEHYRQASDLAPGRADAHYALAQTHFALNEFSPCERALDRIFLIGPSVDDAVYAKALYMFSRLPNDDTAADFFERYPTLKPKVDDPFFFYGMGNLLVRDQQYELSARFFDMANNLKRQAEPYNFSRDMEVLEQHEKNLDEYQSSLDHEIVDLEPRPVFIVGMPRSGSSILEQMLGAHSAITPMGEGDWLLKSIRREAKVGYGPKGIELVATKGKEKAFCEQVRQNFRDIVGAAGSKVVVDKTLANFHFIELIRLAFPNALIIHASREKGPSVWSSFKTNFTKGVRYSESLEELSRYFDGVEALLSRWHDKLPTMMMRVWYEELVAKPEQTVRIILERIGLEFEEDCLRPWQQERIVETASKVQVTQPIYERANLDFEPYRELITTRLKEFEE